MVLFHSRPDLVGEQRQAAAQFADAVGEIALGAALVDMGVPAADVDEAQIELVAHQPADAPGRQLEALGADRVAVGGLHLGARSPDRPRPAP